MTSTFDALSRIVQHYKDKMEYEDYQILRQAIDVVHHIQHDENNHRIDARIQQGIVPKERFKDWMYDRIRLQMDGTEK